MNLDQHLEELRDIAERATLYDPKVDGNGPGAMRQLFRDLSSVASATIALIETQSAPERSQ